MAQSGRWFWYIWFLRAKRAARRIKDNPAKLLELVQDALNKLSKVKGGKKFDAVIDSLKTMTRMIQAFAEGKYREVPTNSIVAIIGAVVYFLWPADAIPDFIFLLGYTDDAGVVWFVVRKLGDDIDDFRRWESGQNPA